MGREHCLQEAVQPTVRETFAGGFAGVKCARVLRRKLSPESWTVRTGGGAVVIGTNDHTVSQSLYLRDPDGNEVELYVDADESVWKNNPAAVLAPFKPLQL
ncbi:MAG: hypothetical protein L0Z46_00985 [Nitrospiraceae bacterium]|nr:hypothetical protein [Nitrospiraceae bacterium]